MAEYATAALPGVTLAAIGAPILRSRVSKRSVIRVTPFPASRLVPPGNDEMIASFMLAPPTDAGPDIGTAGAGAGEAVATEAVGIEPVFGWKVSISQVSLWGANATSSPFIPVTSFPFTVVLPAPRKRNPWRPSPALVKRSFEVLRLYGTYGELTPEELADARWRLETILTLR